MFNFFKDETRCYNGGKQHCYEAVYEIMPGMAPHPFEGTLHAFETIMQLTERKHYIGHVCRWCGDKIKR